MRIALNHSQFGPAGGTEGYLSRLVDHLVSRGDDVVFIGRKATISDGHRFTFERVRCIPVPQALRILTFAYQSARRIQSGRFDVTFGFGRTFGHDIHRDSNGTMEAFRRAVAGTFSRSRFYCRAVTHLEEKLYAANKRLFTIAVSDFIRSQVLAKYDLPENRISVVYNGVDSVRFSPENRGVYRDAVRRELNVGSTVPVALFVGNDWRRKGLTCAIQAIRRAACAWELWVLGEESRHTHFQRQTAAMGLSERVRFLGRRDAVSYYAAADAFVFPSLFDPMANVVLEAMASGLPVIASPTDGAGELIRQAENGFVLEDGANAEELASVLDRLADPSIRAAIGKRARDTAAAFTWERHFEQLDRIFEQVRLEKSRLLRPPCRRASAGSA